jgi:hypothetical protein
VALCLQSCRGGSRIQTGCLRRTAYPRYQTQLAPHLLQLSKMSALIVLQELDAHHSAAVVHTCSKKKGKKRVEKSAAVHHFSNLKGAIMSIPGHSPKLVEVWNPEQKSFYLAHLVDIDEGTSVPFSPFAVILQLLMLKPVYCHRYKCHTIRWRPGFAIRFDSS